MRHSIAGIALIWGLGCAGCTGQGKSTPSSAPASGQQSTAASSMPAAVVPLVTVPVNATADQVVSVFLNALRAGDKATTASLLTARAREETAKYNIDVDPQAAPNAQYAVRKAEILPHHPDGAHVSSVWTEKYSDGEVSYEIVWVLRRQADGWRVAGMAAELIAGQPLQFLDFENPEEMLRKREEALAALQTPAAETAQQPQSPTPAGIPPATIER